LRRFEVLDARASARPVHAYQFEVTSRLLDGALGATHCMDLPFTFPNISRWDDAPFIQGLPSEVIERVTSALHPAWIRFVREGDPGRRRRRHSRLARDAQPAYLRLKFRW
jgi:carboxylesterase type B